MRNQLDAISAKSKAGTLGASFLICLSAFALPAFADNEFQQAPQTPEQIKDKQAFHSKIDPVGTVPLKAPPPGLPGQIMPGNTFLSGSQLRRSNGGKVTQLNYSTAQSPVQVFEWFERALRADQWKVKEPPAKSGQHDWIIGSKNSDTFFNVHITTNNYKKGGAKEKLNKNGCSYTISITEPK